MTRLLAEWIAYVAALPVFAFGCIQFGRAAWRLRFKRQPRAVLRLLLAELALTIAFAIITLSAFLRWRGDGVISINLLFGLRVFVNSSLFIAQVGLVTWVTWLLAPKE